MKSKVSSDLMGSIEKAAAFHGRLGPFLVIGVRMGDIVKRLFNTGTISQVTAKIPLSTPFSCVLDGIQTTTQCTVGNQKLKIENSQKEITVNFKLQNPKRELKISVNQKIVEELTNKISKGASNEELARKIAHMPQTRLFTIEKR